MTAAPIATRTTEQPALFDLEEATAVTEAEREMDRTLCETYFRGWLAAGRLSVETVVEDITYEDFCAAADRLAEAAV